MNSSDQLLQNLNPAHYPETGTLLISGILSNNVFYSLPEGLLVILERTGWWLHLLVIYGFILYLPYSKHLHVFLAFPNSYFSNLNPRGRISNIPVIENEARGMLGLAQNDQIESVESFGAKDIFDLDWRTLLAAYSCTECGRCTSVCPANLTGKN